MSKKSLSRLRGWAGLGWAGLGWAGLGGCAEPGEVALPDYGLGPGSDLPYIDEYCGVEFEAESNCWEARNARPLVSQSEWPTRARTDWPLDSTGPAPVEVGSDIVSHTIDVPSNPQMCALLSQIISADESLHNISPYFEIISAEQLGSLTRYPSEIWEDWGGLPPHWLSFDAGSANDLVPRLNGGSPRQVTMAALQLAQYLASGPEALCARLLSNELDFLYEAQANLSTSYLPIEEYANDLALLYGDREITEDPSERFEIDVLIELLEDELRFVSDSTGLFDAYVHNLMEACTYAVAEGLQGVRTSSVDERTSSPAYSYPGAKVVAQESSANCAPTANLESCDNGPSFRISLQSISTEIISSSGARRPPQPHPVSCDQSTFVGTMATTVIGGEIGGTSLSAGSYARLACTSCQAYDRYGGPVNPGRLPDAVDYVDSDTGSVGWAIPTLLSLSVKVTPQEPDRFLNCGMEQRLRNWRTALTRCTQARPPVEDAETGVSRPIEAEGEWVPYVATINGLSSQSIDNLNPSDEVYWVFHYDWGHVARGGTGGTGPVFNLNFANCIAGSAYAGFQNYIFDQEEQAPPHPSRDGLCDQVKCPRLVRPIGDPTKSGDAFACQRNADGIKDPPELDLRTETIAPNEYHCSSEVVFTDGETPTASFLVKLVDLPVGFDPEADVEIEVDALQDGNDSIAISPPEYLGEVNNAHTFKVTWPRMPNLNSAFGLKNFSVTIRNVNGGCPETYAGDDSTGDVIFEGKVEVFWPLFRGRLDRTNPVIQSLTAIPGLLDSRASDVRDGIISRSIPSLIQGELALFAGAVTSPVFSRIFSMSDCTTTDMAESVAHRGDGGDLGIPNFMHYWSQVPGFHDSNQSIEEFGLDANLLLLSADPEVLAHTCGGNCVGTGGFAVGVACGLAQGTEGLPISSMGITSLAALASFEAHEVDGAAGLAFGILSYFTVVSHEWEHSYSAIMQSRKYLNTQSNSQHNSSEVPWRYDVGTTQLVNWPTPAGHILRGCDFSSVMPEMLAGLNPQSSDVCITQSELAPQADLLGASCAAALRSHVSFPGACLWEIAEFDTDDDGVADSEELRLSGHFPDAYIGPSIQTQADLTRYKNSFPGLSTFNSISNADASHALLYQQQRDAGRRLLFHNAAGPFQPPSGAGAGIGLPPRVGSQDARMRNALMQWGNGSSVRAGIVSNDWSAPGYQFGYIGEPYK